VVSTYSIVKDDEGKAAFWLVPLISGKKAVGFVRLEMNLRVSQVGIFGASAADQESWIDASFFDFVAPSGWHEKTNCATAFEG
jgi:hypothetical protein